MQMRLPKETIEVVVDPILSKFSAETSRKPSQSRGQHPDLGRHEQHEKEKKKARASLTSMSMKETRANDFRTM